MRASVQLIAIAALLLIAPMTMPAQAADPLPATNDFILRAPAAEVAGIATRNGLTVVKQVATAVDEDGHSIYLVRAASGVDPQMVVSDVRDLEPEAAGIEQAVLASLPKLDQSAAVILDTSTVDNALAAVFGFAPPSATVDATWNGHLHDRELDLEKFEPLTLGFELAAGADSSTYQVQIDFADGTSASLMSCDVLIGSALDVGGSDAKWQVFNNTASTVTLESVTAGWPAVNGDLIEVKVGGSQVYAGSVAPSSMSISSGWLETVDKRQIDPGKSEELKLEWAGGADQDLSAYTLSITTAEGHSAQYDPAIGGCAVFVDDRLVASGNQVELQVGNFGTGDLVVDSVTVSWPQGNGKLLTAQLHGDSLMDAPYVEFGEDADGDDREVWSGFVNQAGAQQLELDEAQRSFGGEATVAIIDTGIDPNHGVLADRIVPGYDFVNGVAGSASEWADLDQSAAVILDQSAAVILDQSAAVILDQSAAVILDQSAAVILDTSTIPPAFGHGTMVAGVIHRAAPEASLMPLKVFDANGYAHLYDIVDAIYYAVDNGANVINMSFSLETFSEALMRAINYAARNGVACVASAGNHGEEKLVFPASFGNTIGVASVDDADELSAFSNWGSDLVTIAAPGENIVTTYPGSRFAVASGTSFAAPWIAGGAAIFSDKLGTKHAPGLADYYLSSNALAAADPVAGSGQGRSGHGRANLKRAVGKVRSGRYANDRPLGQYTITATFAEGCTASYPPPSTGGGCTVEGASQLKFAGRKVLWNLSNEGENDATLDSISITWEADNGDLEKIELDGTALDQTLVAPVTYTIGSGWLGLPEDRVLAPHESLELLFEFDNNVIWTY